MARDGDETIIGGERYGLERLLRFRGFEELRLFRFALRGGRFGLLDRGLRDRDSSFGAIGDDRGRRDETGRAGERVLGFLQFALGLAGAVGGFAGGAFGLFVFLLGLAEGGCHLCRLRSGLWPGGDGFLIGLFRGFSGRCQILVVLVLVGGLAGLLDGLLRFGDGLIGFFDGGVGCL